MTSKDSGLTFAPPAPSIGAEMARTLFGLRWRVAALFVVLGLKAALAPSLAWVTKAGIDAVRAAGATVFSVTETIGPIFIAIIVAGAIIEFGEKLASKAMEVRLIIALQRIYLDRRRGESAARDVSQVLYGCDIAKKGFEVVYKDAWRIGAETLSVIVWQLSLDPEWIPLMLAAVLPALLFVWWFGPYIQRVSADLLDVQRHLAATTAQDQRGHFQSSQERMYRSTLVFEVLKWIADRGMEAVLWVVLLACAGTIYLLDVGLLPDPTDVGAAAAFVVNLRLIAKPLSEIGKVYTKWREAWPAILPVYGR